MKRTGRCNIPPSPLHIYIAFISFPHFTFKQHLFCFFVSYLYCIYFIPPLYVNITFILLPYFTFALHLLYHIICMSNHFTGVDFTRIGLRLKHICAYARSSATPYLSLFKYENVNAFSSHIAMSIGIGYKYIINTFIKSKQNPIVSIFRKPKYNNNISKQLKLA